MIRSVWIIVEAKLAQKASGDNGRKRPIGTERRVS